jgi:hypothetical protein
METGLSKTPSVLLHLSFFTSAGWLTTCLFLTLNEGWRYFAKSKTIRSIDVSFKIFYVAPLHMWLTTPVFFGCSQLYFVYYFVRVSLECCVPN